MLKRALLFFSLLASAGAESADTWSAPCAPFRVMDNVYSVGTQGVGVFLITTRDGHILLDASTDAGAREVAKNIRRLGFRLNDVKLLLETHAHFDHVGGTARLKRDTGAQFLASAGDRSALEHGHHEGDNLNGATTFAAVHVDRVIADGESVELGGVKLTALATPGHTRGDTSWSMTVQHKGKPLRLLFFGSTSVAGNVLVHNRSYPGIVDDYRGTFKRLKQQPVDVFLANHPSFNRLHAKHARGQSAAFIEPHEFAGFIRQSEKEFEQELAAQRKAAPSAR